MNMWPNKRLSPKEIKMGGGILAKRLMVENADVFEIATEVSIGLNPILHLDDISAMLEDMVGQHGLTEENFKKTLDSVTVELRNRGFTVRE